MSNVWCEKSFIVERRDEVMVNAGDYECFFVVCLQIFLCSFAM